MEYDDTNRGILWLNEKKSEKAPDYTGKYNHEGEEIKLAGWVRTSKTGKTFISISRDTYEPKTGKESDAWQQAREKLAPQEEVDKPLNLSDIPF